MSDSKKRVRFVFTKPDGTQQTSEELEAELKAQVEKLEKPFHEALFRLAILYTTLGQPQAAEGCFARALATTADPDRQALACLSMGQVLEQQSLWAEAEQRYAQGLALNAGSQETRYLLNNNRGFCLNLLGRHEQAEHFTRTAIGIDPKRHNAYKNCGLSCLGHKRFVEAAKFLLEADRLCPEDRRSLEHLRQLVMSNREILEDPEVAAACKERGIGGLAR